MNLVSTKPILLLAAFSALALSGCTRSINDIAPAAQQPRLLPAAPTGPVQSVNTLPPPLGAQGVQNSTLNNGLLNNGQVYNNQIGQGQLSSVNPQGLPTAPSAAPTAPTAPYANVATAPSANGATTPAATMTPITREAVSGTWQVVSDSSSCRMILAFTKWQGGYRAATRKCSSPEIGSVSAWDIKGKQVILMDANGNAIGKLYKSASERYDGTTNSGASIVFTRS